MFLGIGTSGPTGSAARSDGDLTNTTVSTDVFVFTHKVLCVYEFFLL